MKKILLICAGVILALLVIWLVVTRSSSLSETPGDDASVSIPTEDPLDVVLDFYNAWLAAAASTTTDPIAANVLSLPMISTEVRNAIATAYGERTTNDPDPVLCQLTVPERIGGKELYRLDTSAEYQIFARGGETRSPLQAVVTLGAVAGAWQISNIRCVAGETAPEREFDFDSEGFLLKSVQPPLDPNLWHLVYEVDGQLGYTVPLYFSESSTCIAADGTESICAPDSFTETSRVRLQADMTEAGAQVRRLTF